LCFLVLLNDKLGNLRGNKHSIDFPFIFLFRIVNLAFHCETNKDRNLSPFPHNSFVLFSPFFDEERRNMNRFPFLFPQQRGIILCTAEPIWGLHLNHHNKILIMCTSTSAGDCHRRRVRSGITRRSRHHTSRTDADVTLPGRSSTEHGTKMEASSKWATD
jgi:hypothetical protein